MKIQSIQGANDNFKGKRLDKNAVAQLVKNNPYSLTEPNQRYITSAIERLGLVAGEKNIEFLLDVAAKSKYSTSITLQDAPKNDWRNKLLAAAASAIAITPLADNTLADKLLSLQQKPVESLEEKEILALREQLLAVVDLEQINNETIGSARNFVQNLDYFIISSETTLEHKKYVLDRLNYLMSNDYEINPQLEDKKSIVAAEIVNDIAIHTPGNKIPNIKAVNQKQHGMCAAISIVRKKLAYEDKPNYIDSILSELDSSDVLMVYDRSNLGSGKKVGVHKVPVDFDAALAKGYRIIDASTTHWMQIASMTGTNNISYNVYNPFDSENFDVKADSFFHAQFEDEEMAKSQAYYQALVKANSVIEDYKTSRIKREIEDQELMQNSENFLRAAARISNNLKDELAQIAPNLSSKGIQELYSGLIGLEKATSVKIDKNDKFSYIPNEETIVKKEKIKHFITSKSGIKEFNEEFVDKLLFLIEEYHSLTVRKNKPSMIKQASNLYDIAAAFRYQMIVGLDDKNNLHNTMINEGITNKESLILDTIDKLIEKLENSSPDSGLIIAQLQESVFDNTDGSKDTIIAALNELKAIINYHLTESLDNIYAALTMGSRKDALLSYIGNFQSIFAGGNNYYLEAFAEALGVKKAPKNVLRALEADKQKLQNGGEKEYIEIFNKYKNVSQLEYINKLYQSFTEKCAQDDNQKIVLEFLKINNLSVEDGEEAFTERLGTIEQNLQAISTFIDQVSSLLKIVDKNGDVIISASPKDVIVKKFENEGRIVSAKQLRELQEHLDRIAKVRSSDEFQSRQGKLKDKSLTNFSANEKETLKEIDKSVDAMYAFVQKQLKYMQSKMKDYLEELARLAGINEGNYWVGQEGRSGLFTAQEIRILEYMTGRPHYSTENYRDAIEKIKTSPYSGISSSSVYHDKAGMHAQYIADIAPIELRSGIVKDVLFNDNTWGASELENTWVDSEGLTRTDYSDRRGGALGYITNNEFRNGNFVDRILSDMIVQTTPDTTENRVYKKIKHTDKNTHSFPQYADVILDGKSKEIKTVSDKIHDALFVTNNRFVKKLRDIGKKHTESELQAMITDIDGTGKNWKPIYEELKNRIFSITGGKIQSKADYEALADDDYLKVVLEKMALKANAQITGLEPDIARVRDIRELSKFRAAQKTRALNAFKYAFAKSLKSIDYLSDSFGDKEFLEMQAILDKHKIQLTDEELDSIGEYFGLDRDLYNGSAKTTINLILESLREDIDKIISNKEVKEELENFFRKFMTDKIYFSKEDLDLNDLDNQRIAHIIKFIDRVFDPADDEEFVEIFRRIQDMTTEEFKNEILSKASYEDMGVKSLTGYDMLQRIQRYEEKANTDLMNTVYYDSLVDEINDKNYEPNYSFNKLSRIAKYTPRHTFTSMYRDLHYDLSLLTLPKLFNKYKGRNLEQYGVYPAYPRIEYLTEETIENSFSSAVGQIEKNIDTIKTIQEQIKNYEIAHLLQKLKKATTSNIIISGENYSNLSKLFERLILLNLNDSSVKEVTDAAEAALKLEEGSHWFDYLPIVNIIIRRLTDFENTTPQKLLEEVIKQNQMEITAQKRVFTEVFIQPKYKTRMAEKLNQYQQALVKQDKEYAEMLKEELLDAFTKHHILNDPEELLKQFILSIPKDAKLHSFSEFYEKLLLRAIDYAKLFEIQDIIMDAINDGVAINAKSRFNKHMLTFGDNEYSMDSNEMVTYMTNNLILDNQFDTALLFLEKLGLNEQYIKYSVQNFDYDKLEELIRSTYALADNFNKFQDAIEPSFATILEEFEDDNCDYKTLLNNLRAVITEKAKEFSIDEEILAPLFKGIDAVEFNCDENPIAQKKLVFATVMSTSKQNTTNLVSEKVEEDNNILTSNTTIINFINQVMLPKESDAHKFVEEANLQFSRLFNLRNSLLDLQEQEESDKI